MSNVIGYDEKKCLHNYHSNGKGEEKGKGRKREPTTNQFKRKTGKVREGGGVGAQKEWGTGHRVKKKGLNQRSSNGEQKADVEKRSAGDEEGQACWGGTKMPFTEKIEGGGCWGVPKNLGGGETKILVPCGVQWVVVR